MSGFLEVAIIYTFHSPLCVRSSGSSAYRRGTWGHLGFIYVQRRRASKFWRSYGTEARKIFPASPQTFPLPLSLFEAHPRRPPVTQYAIVGLASKQSSYYHDYTSLEMHREAGNAPGRGISRENDTDGKFPWIQWGIHAIGETCKTSFLPDVLRSKFPVGRA